MIRGPSQLAVVSGDGEGKRSSGRGLWDISYEGLKPFSSETLRLGQLPSTLRSAISWKVKFADDYVRVTRLDLLLVITLRRFSACVLE